MKHNLLWDCHMHSDFSADSDTPMEAMILRAISLGLEGICFTEHLDMDFPVTPDNVTFDLDIPAYYDHYLSVKEKYKDRLDIRFGIELGLQTHLAQKHSDLLKAYPFDFVIGSSHLVNGRDPYYPSFFEGRSEADAYREYFESALDNIRKFSEMDVYGHLDYVVRYGPNQNKEYSYKKYADILDEILMECIATDTGLEVNTGGYHYGLGAPNPCREIIKRYLDLGGEIITIGSDAHQPEKAGYDFDRAAALLYDCGARYYHVFRDRHPEARPL